MKAVSAKVLRIVEKPLRKVRFMLPVGLYFFRDRCRILAKETCNLFKGSSLIQGFFNINPVLECKVLLVSGYKVAHVSSFHCCQKETTREHT